MYEKRSANTPDLVNSHVRRAVVIAYVRLIFELEAMYMTDEGKLNARFQ